MSLFKKAPETVVRIETNGCQRVCPPYGGTVDRLPATFWEIFQESLNGSGAEEGMDAAEWSLVQSAHDLGYHSGHEIVESTGWAEFIAPLQSAAADAGDVLHATFAALSGMGLDDCEIVEMVPFERLVLRVYGYWGLLIPGPGRNRRRATLVVRGLCAAVMDLAYGGPYDDARRGKFGPHTCRQTRSVERGDAFDEFVTTRA